MLRSGKVVAAENGVLEVCFERPEACAHCGQCAGQKKETLVKVPGDAPVGRWIDVDMPEGQVLKASMLAYVMPLLMLLGGLALGSVIFENDLLKDYGVISFFYDLFISFIFKFRICRQEHDRNISRCAVSLLSQNNLSILCHNLILKTVTMQEHYNVGILFDRT